MKQKFKNKVNTFIKRKLLYKKIIERVTNLWPGNLWTIAKLKNWFYKKFQKYNSYIL
jgi:hypothetical protein